MWSMAALFPSCGLCGGRTVLPANVRELRGRAYFGRPSKYNTLHFSLNSSGTGEGRTMPPGRCAAPWWQAGTARALASAVPAVGRRAGRGERKRAEDCPALSRQQQAASDSSPPAAAKRASDSERALSRRPPGRRFHWAAARRPVPVYSVCSDE